MSHILFPLTRALSTREREEPTKSWVFSTTPGFVSAWRRIPALLLGWSEGKRRVSIRLRLPFASHINQRRLGFTDFQAGHPAVASLFQERFPRDKERVPFRNLLGILGCPLGQLLRLAEQENRFRRQIIKQRPEAWLRVEGAREG